MAIKPIKPQFAQQVSVKRLFSALLERKQEALERRERTHNFLEKMK